MVRLLPDVVLEGGLSGGGVSPMPGGRAGLTFFLEQFGLILRADVNIESSASRRALDPALSDALLTIEAEAKRRRQ